MNEERSFHQLLSKSKANQADFGLSQQQDNTEEYVILREDKSDVQPGARANQVDFGKSGQFTGLDAQLEKPKFTSPMALCKKKLSNSIQKRANQAFDDVPEQHKT